MPPYRTIVTARMGILNTEKAGSGELVSAEHLDRHYEAEQLVSYLILK